MTMLAITLPALIGAVSVLLGICALVGASIVVVLRSTKNEIIADQERRIAQLKEERDDERLRCAADTARLQGQVDTLEGGLAERLITAVAEALTTQRRTRGGDADG